jgi:DNA-binding NtrC family response regulator
MTQPMKSIRLLLVEDDAIDRQAVRRALGRAGTEYEITEACTCEEASSHLATEKFDLILLDYDLGGRSGIDFMEAHEDLSFVMVTGNGNEVVAAEAVHAGVADYLIKDLAGMYLQLLPHIINRVVARREALDERERLLRELQEAQNTINTLRGFIPICSVCKKIRDDGGYWQQIETYIRARSDAEFSHTYCPDCYANATLAINQLLGEIAPEAVSPKAGTANPT